MEVGVLGTTFQRGVDQVKIGSNPLAKRMALAHDQPQEGRGLSRDEVKSLLLR
jgi:hypothetical protein